MPDVIVVGGGIIGMMTARALHLAGVDVRLVERGPLGGESSWAGGGIISPLYPWRYSDAVNQLAAISKTIYPQLVQQLQDESGIDCELLNSGLLFAGLEQTGDADAWAEQWSVQHEWITSRQQLQDVEPEIADDYETGLWLPEIMQVRNPKVVKALKGSFERLGIPYSENTPVTSLITKQGKVCGVSTEAGDITANKVIVASGAWSASVAGDRQAVQIEPVKGQMIMFRGEPGLVTRMVLSEGHYIIPRRDGHVLAGSTLERTGFDKQTTEVALQELQRDAAQIIPVLSELEIERQWAGLRPGTEQGIPYICQHNEIEGLYIHAGHYRNGIVLGPASVQLMTDIVIGNKPSINPAPYTLDATH